MVKERRRRPVSPWWAGVKADHRGLIIGHQPSGAGGRTQQVIDQPILEAGHRSLNGYQLSHGCGVFERHGSFLSNDERRSAIHIAQK